MGFWRLVRKKSVGIVGGRVEGRGWTQEEHGRQKILLIVRAALLILDRAHRSPGILLKCRLVSLGRALEFHLK